MSFFIITLGFFVYDIKGKSKTWEDKAVIRKMIPLLKVVQTLRPMENASSRKAVIGKAAMADPSR